MTLSAQQLAALKQALEKGLARLSKQQMGAWALSNPGPTKVSTLHMLEPFVRAAKGPAKSK